MTLLVVLLSLAALAGWGYQRYVGLVQRQVEIADASARLDASNRARLELVANLLHGSAGELPPAVSVTALETAHDLVAQLLEHRIRQRLLDDLLEPHHSLRSGHARAAL